MPKVRIVNKMEEVVKSGLDEIYAGSSDLCKCPRCKLDIIAFALNSLPPKYVVTTSGEIFTNVALDSSQWKADVMIAIYRGIDIVRKKPRH